MPDRNNYAPRLGLAYRLGDNTTIRAGFGVFYAYTGGGAAVNNMLSTPPFFVFVNLNSEPDHAADPHVPICFPVRETTTTGVSSNQDLNQRTGYLYNYNLNIQRQLRPGLLFETGFMGNTGQKQYGSVLLNQPRLPAEQGQSGVVPDAHAVSDPAARIQPEHELPVEQLQRRLREVRAAACGTTFPTRSHTPSRN